MTDNETSALEEKNKRDNYTQLVGACLVRKKTAVCMFVRTLAEDVDVIALRKVNSLNIEAKLN